MKNKVYILHHAADCEARRFHTHPFEFYLSKDKEDVAKQYKHKHGEHINGFIQVAEVKATDAEFYTMFGYNVKYAVKELEQKLEEVEQQLRFATEVKRVVVMNDHLNKQEA